jgi:hypothetical protein
MRESTAPRSPIGERDMGDGRKWNTYDYPLGFTVRDRRWVVRNNGSTRPASEEEVLMWDRITDLETGTRADPS